MKRILLAAAFTAMCAAIHAETIVLGETEYTIDRLIERQVGPGITYTRLRLPDYPLNVNITTVDLSNPYNRIETTCGRESSRGTELLVDAAARQSHEGHRPIAGANANFWYVGRQVPQGSVFAGIAIGASVRNGKIITETNQHYDQFDFGSLSTGIIGIDYDKVAHIAPVTSTIKISSDKFGPAEVHQCNKGVWGDEIGMYNSHYGADTPFQPLERDWDNQGMYYVIKTLSDVTEVVLDFAEGADWRTATDLNFVVREVRTASNGLGTLGEHDLALVGRGDNAALLAALAPGDALTLNYSWTFEPGTENEVTPQIENAVGGNAIVMFNGELRSENDNHSYCSMIYSRCGYGISADGKTFYIIVIDKSIDPVYGASNGCNTAVMCNIAKHFGVNTLANLDAGGSAQMFIDGAIINKTTEGSPRQVCNGMFVYSTAPEDDNTVASIAFYDRNITQPVFSTSSPAIIAYNRYGAVIDYDYKDITFTCSDGAGTCDGNTFTAGSSAGTVVLTAHCGDISVSKEIEIIEATPAMHNTSILIDTFTGVPVAVDAIAGGKIYSYNPATIAWTVADPDILTIDQGVMHGLRDGSTHISGTIGSQLVEADVTVETATAPAMPLAPFASWTVKGASGMKDVSMDGSGAVTYSFGKKTMGHLEFAARDFDFWSLPSDIFSTFRSSVPVASVAVDLRPANSTSVVPVKFEPEEPYAAGEDHRLDFDLASAIDMTDNAIYPIAVPRIRFTFVTRPENQGAQTFTFGNVMGVYPQYDSVVSVDADGGDFLLVSPNPVEAGAVFTVRCPGITEASLYTVSGTLVARAAAVDGSVALVAPAAGTYVVSAATEAGPAAAILLVR